MSEIWSGGGDGVCCIGHELRACSLDETGWGLACGIEMHTCRYGVHGWRQRVRWELSMLTIRASVVSISRWACGIYCEGDVHVPCTHADGCTKGSSRGL